MFSASLSGKHQSVAHNKTRNRGRDSEWRQPARSSQGEETMDLNCLGKGWFAIQVRPRYEFVTSKHLRNKGYEEFVPVYSEKRKWSDREKKIDMPLFTGYVFCRLDPEVRSPIVTTPGVIRIVGNSKGIARIDDAEIAVIQAAIRAGVKARP